MPARASPCIAFSIVSLVLLLIVGCGGEGTKEAAEWTVEEGALTLERNLLAGDDEEYYFGQVGDVAVGADGQMYVVDGEAVHVKVLAPDGTLRDSVGREGEGPGEFRRISAVAVARSDSLYVLDAFRRRVSVFGPGGAFAYSLARSKTQGPSDVIVSAEAPGFIFVYAPAARRVVQNNAPYVVRSAGADGAADDTLFTARPYQMAMRKVDGGMLFARIPFAREPHFAAGADGRIYHAWSGGLSVRTYDRTGRAVDTVEVPFDPVPVTDADIERALEDRDRTRDLVRNRIPSTKPAFEEFLVDDQGRYWFGRPTANPDSTAWWVAWPDEKRVATTRLSDEVDIEAVRGGYAYGETSTEKGAPALVRYRIRVNSEQ
ncbi:MAG: 6-bladed beta-propeller [Salinibacter sp.]|uniref:6-bladed beta-propeller n=1 Tax=Salinibacter sp. TaxID=2065818 RepID=UPI0035D4C330